MRIWDKTTYVAGPAQFYSAPSRSSAPTPLDPQHPNQPSTSASCLEQIPSYPEHISYPLMSSPVSKSPLTTTNHACPQCQSPSVSTVLGSSRYFESLIIEAALEVCKNRMVQIYGGSPMMTSLMAWLIQIA